MLEVAPLVAIGGWDRTYEHLWSGAWSATTAAPGCTPLESQPHQSGPYIDFKSFWNSIAPRAPNNTDRRGYMQCRPALTLVQPDRTRPTRRRRSTSERHTKRQSEAKEASHHAKNDLPLPQPLETIECLPVPEAPSLGSLNSISFERGRTRYADTLLSSVASIDGRPYEPKGLCDLCRQPFEVDEDALHAHISRHWSALAEPVQCGRCHILFSHEGDLNWHLRSVEHNNRYWDTDELSPTTSRGRTYNDGRLKYWERLRHWEQAQLRLHCRTIEDLDRTRSNRPSPRSSSLPPRNKQPFSVAADRDLRETCQSHATANKFDTNYNHVETGSKSLQGAQSIGLNGANKTQEDVVLTALQKRIRDLMERLQPTSPGTIDQDTPYSEFCDTHSLPGSPEQVSKDQTSPKTNRAISEPPIRNCPVGECVTRAAPGYSSGSDARDARDATNGGWALPSAATGHKRCSQNHDGHWEDDDESNGGLQPKKRKTINETTADVEKKFPCIFHVGDPVQFHNDTTRHRHISNMCRHLKVHNFFTCSTCILRLSNNDELERHSGQHVKACSMKGCKRTKPAGHQFDTVSCAHIMKAEDQWRAMFVLQFNRTPPRIFSTGLHNELHVIDSRESTHDTSDSTNLPSQTSPQFLADCSGVIGMSDSFFDQAMDFDLGLPVRSNDQPVTPPLDVTDFLEADLPVLEAIPTEEGAVDHITHKQHVQAIREEHGPPMHDLITSLQEQVTALESILSKQNKEKDRVFSLQEQVVQLEQKLFQSSEREQQLEATLSVIFDAFQATGAPQAQENKPLWKLVMSHSSQAIGSTSSNPRQNEGKDRTSSNSFLSMSPNLSFAAGSKLTAQTPPDSTYGSIR